MNKKRKSKISLIIILVIALITLGITVGICCYNYYGYAKYKVQYLEDYFDINKEHQLTNKEKIDRYQNWKSYAYTDELTYISFRDPITKEEINNTKLVSEHAQNSNAYIEGTTLHLPKYFDLNFYTQVVESLSEDQSKYVYSLNYEFYFSSIDYNQIPDFDPQYIHMTFVNGIGEESDEALLAALQETEDTGISIGMMPRLCSEVILNKDGDTTLASVSIEDNARNVFEEDEDFYYIYSNSCAKSYDDASTFGYSKDGLTFSVYYLDEEKGSSSFINILEGTFKPELNDKDKILTTDDFLAKENIVKGYSKNYYQDSYNEFIKPKIILTAVISFVASLLVCLLFTYVWMYDYNQNTTVNKKKK